jgi:hypothetical protein
VNADYEHDVYLDPDNRGYVIKNTLPGEYGGMILDEDGRNAIPSDYFGRIALGNAFLDNGSNIIGRTGTGKNLPIVTRQPQHLDKSS